MICQIAVPYLGSQLYFTRICYRREVFIIIKMIQFIKFHKVRKSLLVLTIVYYLMIFLISINSIDLIISKSVIVFASLGAGYVFH